MAKKFDFKRLQNLAIDKIDYFGKNVKVVVETNNSDGYDWKAKEETIYDTKAVFIPPVNGIYFQHTRFGSNTWTTEELQATKKACMVAPIFVNGELVSLTNIIAVIEDDVRYSVTFADTFCPANDVIFYAFGLGR